MKFPHQAFQHRSFLHRAFWNRPFQHGPFRHKIRKVVRKRSVLKRTVPKRTMREWAGTNAQHVPLVNIYELTKSKRYVSCIGFITTFCHLIFLICSQLILISMTISQGRHLNFILHLIIQMSEEIIFRFTVLNFGTVYPETLQIQHLSQ